MTRQDKEFLAFLFVWLEHHLSEQIAFYNSEEYWTNSKSVKKLKIDANELLTNYEDKNG
jgi:hypothetical protein